jgi:ArsR family transcriptional regulator, arsenate/arsenite/antimonite-responsive transcriptional repressor / arsenate reductase (thioredoxin)
MDASIAIATFGALAQPTRLAAVRRLLAAWPDALPSGELARLCGTPPTTLSDHLAILARAGLVRAERAGRTINYRAEAATLRQLMAFLARDCCGDRRDLCGGFAGVAAAADDGAADAPVQRPVVPAFNVLFLGTRNAARSIIAEALLRKLGGARFTAWSAGAQPARQPMPEVLGRLSRLGCDVAPLRCKPWDTFIGRDAPRLDFVLVLGDAGRGRPWPESRSAFGDKPIVAAWPLPDPNAYKGPLAERAVLLDELLGMVQRRVEIFIGLPFASLDRTALTRRLAEIGDLAGGR